MWPFKKPKNMIKSPEDFWARPQTSTSRPVGIWNFEEDVSPALDNTEPVSEFKFPPKSQTLEEVASKHMQGPFEYVTITSQMMHSKKDLNNMLLSKMEGAQTRVYDVNNFPVVKLNVNSLTMTIDKSILTAISDRVGKKQLMAARKSGNAFLEAAIKRHMKDYVTYSFLLFNFDPTTNVHNKISHVKMAILDNRLKRPESVRSMIFNSNMSYTGLFSMDHSVHKDDLHHMALRIDNPNNPFKPGIVWGSLTIDLTVIESDRSLTMDTLAVTGTYRTALSFFLNHRRNPAHLDATIDQNTKEELMPLFRSGQILDRTTASYNQKIDFSRAVGSAADSVDLANREQDFEGEDERTMSPEPSEIKPSVVSFAQHQASLQRPPAKSILKKDKMRSPPPKPAVSLPSSPVMSPNNPFRNQVALSPLDRKSPLPPSSPKPLAPSSPYLTDSELLNTPRGTAHPTVLNAEATKDSNLGSVTRRAHVFAGPSNPHVIATTELLPAHSKLFDPNISVPADEF